MDIFSNKGKLVMAMMLAMAGANAADLLVESESFRNKGGWVVDQQFVDMVGSPYLMAHGLGKPVADAVTEADFAQDGIYHVYVRTFNWTAPWFKGAGPGKFQISVNQNKLPVVLGDSGDSWQWQKAGVCEVKKGKNRIALHDLTGFNGRCDAIYFTTDEKAVPPAGADQLAQFRLAKLPHTGMVREVQNFDIVVVGGGIAGISAAVTAARLGNKVALINDRPVLGGNNSSEIRVHMGGRIESGKYKNLGNLQKEFTPLRGGNAKPADYYEDDKKSALVAAEKKLTLFAGYRANAVAKSGSKIESVSASHIESGNKICLSAPVFIDCTGDGTVGFLAGADYRMGREARSEYNESTAPETADKMTMGASVQWYSTKQKAPVAFPVFEYGMKFNAANCEKVDMGEWTWETGMNFDQIRDFERIRDYGLLVVFSNWSFLKNQLGLYPERQLEWVAYIAGKRESRRLLGDHVLTENDLVNFRVYPDGTAATTWTIDLHYPDPKNTANFPGAEFKSIARHIKIHPYPVPYRCLYSRNVDNLLMAGRHISVTHVALGTIRVMRTTGMLGEVAGMAGFLCNKHQTTPRGVYRNHLPELKALMQAGAGDKSLPNNQQYNQGASLGEKISQ